VFSLLTPNESTVTNVLVHYLIDALPTYWMMGSVFHLLHKVIIAYFKECLSTAGCNMKTILYKLLFFQSGAS
jgi:hypothetical protein